MRNPQHKEKRTVPGRQTKVYGVLAGLCLTAFAVLAVLAAGSFFHKAEAKREFAALQEETAVPEAGTGGMEDTGKTKGTKDTEISPVGEQKTSGYASLPEDAAIPEKELDFGKLTAEVNEHIYAWIYIPGTLVDYPIVRHPAEESYYLNRNLDGSSGYPGCIYVDPVNAADFSDPNTVIYGHNMKDDSMFGSLHEYRDRQFFDENRYLYIYTPEKTLVYEIFAAYEYSDIHLIYSFDLSNPEIFQIYLDQIFEIRDMTANIRDDREVTADDRIVTLSTCIGGKDTMRYLVQGVLIYEQEQ